jgi:hypothetical protein
VFTVTVTVYRNPAAPFSYGNQTNCVGVVPNPALSVSVASGVAVDWYANASGGAPVAVNTTAYVPTDTLAGTYHYYAQARAVSTGCLSPGRTRVSLVLIACQP